MMMFSASGAFAGIGRRLMLAYLFCLPLASIAAAPDEEAAARTAFSKQYKDKKPEVRVDAVKTLAGLHQDKSVALLVSALKDPSLDVRKAVAETLESVTDGAGAATRPLCLILANKKEDADLRLAAAKALCKGSYKSDPIKALLIAITIDEADKAHYAFGMECTKLLNAFAGQDFGMTKETPERWTKWYKENQPKLLHEDQETYAAYKKGATGKAK